MNEYHKMVYRNFVTFRLQEVFHGYSSISEELLHKIWFALIIRRAINCREVSDANRIHWGRRMA